jgi:hypothetical protein
MLTNLSRLLNKVRRCDQVIIVLLQRGQLNIVYALMHSLSLSSSRSHQVIGARDEPRRCR